MYTALCNIPTLLEWKDFKFDPCHQGNESDSWKIRAAAVNKVVQEIAKQRGFIDPPQVAISNPFISPSAPPDTISIPSDWLLCKSETRNLPKKKATFVESIGKTITNLKGSHPDPTLPQFESGFIRYHISLSKEEDRDISCALLFIIQHEMGHIHHQHVKAPLVNIGAGLGVFLTFSAIGMVGLRNTLSRGWSLKACATLFAASEGLGLVGFFVTYLRITSHINCQREREADSYAVKAENPLLKSLSNYGGAVAFKHRLNIERFYENLEQNAIDRLQGVKKWMAHMRSVWQGICSHFSQTHPPSQERLKALKAEGS
ncbi:MAG: M48 family metalloprotease [Verrucomicrobia bacterium]|nr:M48 family metalloprotease [Verrucomicrobiota bacterium]